MKTSINAGLMDMLKSLFDSLGRWFRESEYEVESSRQLGGGAMEYIIRPVPGRDNDKLIMRSLPSQKEEGTFDVRFIHEVNRGSEAEVTKREVPANRMKKEIEDIIKLWWGIDKKDQNKQDSKAAAKTLTTSATKIGIKKVVSNDSEDIYLTKISCSTDSAKVLSDISLLLDSDSFIESIPEDSEQYYMITEDDEGSSIDVDTCEDFECDFNATLQTCMNWLETIRSSVIACKWNVAGAELDFVRTICDDIRWQVDSSLDQLYRYGVDSLGSAQPAAPFADKLFNITGPIHLVEISSYFQSTISELIASLDILYMCEASEELSNLKQTWQSLLSDRIVRYSL